jgi:putative PEP-CTERM system TPR-repeat lipoprotein
MTIHNVNRTRAAALAAAVMASLLVSGCEFFVSNEQRIQRAEQALAAGDAGAAVVDLKNVLRKEPGNSRARLLLSRAEYLTGDVATAGSDFDKVDAAQVKAEDYEPVRWRLLLAQRKYDEVVKGLTAPRPGLADPDRRLFLARAELALGRAAEAKEVLGPARQAEPRRADLRAVEAQATAASGDPAQALALVEAGLKELPGDGELLRTKGELLMRSGQAANAAQAFRQALDASNPKRDMTAYLQAAGGLAETLLIQSKVDEAAALAKDLSKAAPGSALTVLLNGRVAAARKDYPTAMENLQKLLNADPENAQVRTMVANVQLAQGALEQASANLTRVIAAQPAYGPARRLLAQVQMAQGRPAEAARTLEAAAGIEGATTPDLLLMQARAALAAGDEPGAMRILGQLEAQGVPTEAVRLDLAAAYIQLGKSERALQVLGASGAGEDMRREQLRLVAKLGQDRKAGIRALEEYAQAHQGDPHAIQFAAQTLASQGQVQTAIALLEKLADARPKDPDTLAALARVQAQAGQLYAAETTLKRLRDVRPGADADVALAQLAAARGQDEAALKHLEDARAADPKAIAPRALLARAYLQKNQLDAAQKVAAELVALAPGKPEPRLLSASIAARRKDVARATREADEAVKLAPDVAAAWMGKGEVHELLGQGEEARAAYRKALALAPQSALPSLSLARLELSSGNVDAALEAARAAQRQPETRLAGLGLEADILTKLGRHADAARVIEQAQASQPSARGAIALFSARLRAGAPAPEKVLQDWISAHPKELEPRAALAEYWQSQSKADRAIAEYEAALKIEPDAPLFLNNLAWLYSEKKDPRALATARRARELAPRNPAIADTLGWILFNANQQQEGLALLREAGAGAPGSVDIQYHLATALSRSGNSAEAKAVADRVLERKPSPEWQQKFGQLIR